MPAGAEALVDARKHVEGNLVPTHPENGLQFGFHPIRKKAIVEMDSDLIESVEFSKDLASILGLSAQKVTGSVEGQKPVDILHRHRNIYVHCSAITPQVLGNTMQDVLRVIPLNSWLSWGETQTTSPQPIWYIRVRESHLASIRVQLRSEAGDLLNHQFGTTIVSLHLRRI